MVLVTTALRVLVGGHRVRFCAEGTDHYSDLAAGDVQVSVECREEAVWELVVDRVRSAGIAVE